jgi:HK97 family phage prohead protease
MNPEYRLLSTQSDGGTLRGLIATNVISQNLGGFCETISNGAFDQTLRDNSDVICCVNHDPSQLLGRTSSKTLKLQKTNNGLVYTCILPNTSLGNDVRELLSRGDLSKSSFAFVCKDDTWDQGKDGIPLRTVRSLQLNDCSVVTTPAYLQSTAELTRAIPDSCPVEIRQLIESKANQPTFDFANHIAELRQKLALDEIQYLIEEDRNLSEEEVRVKNAKIISEIRELNIQHAEEEEKRETIRNRWRK